MKSDARYIPSRCFETFPQPRDRGSNQWEVVRSVSELLQHHRSELLAASGFGFTKTYHRVNDPDCHDLRVVRLRELHLQLDVAVRDTYGWSDLDLDHQHWETPQGIRFTVSPEAKDELLDRLLELNHERYQAEVAAGLHDKKAKAPAKRAAKPANPSQETLL